MIEWKPPVDWTWDAARDAAGSGRQHFSLSGLELVLEGLDPETDEFVVRRFRRYLVSRGEGEPALRLVFRKEPAAPFVASRSAEGEVPTYRMEHAVREGFLYYASGTLCARIDIERGTGTVLLRDRTGDLAVSDPVHLATENMLRAALGWLVLQRGGFMLHSASVVRDGRCYLFFGNSGAGKSTIASICGGQVISDDLTLVLPAGERFAAIGSPFRGTYTACEDLTDRYPVVGLFRLRKSESVAVAPVAGPRAFADFLANLPFVVSEIQRHPGAWDRARAAFEKLRVFELHFRKDDSFWSAVDALRLA